jgi:hypothetical protein
MSTQNANLRIWKDSAMNGAWRCSYRDGDSTVVVSFPDLKALGDFIAEELGLSVIGALARSGDASTRPERPEFAEMALAY